MRLLSTWGLTRAASPFSRPPPSPLSCSPLKPLARLFKTEALSLASEVTHLHGGRRPYPIIMSIILVNEPSGRSHLIRRVYLYRTNLPSAKHEIHFFHFELTRQPGKSPWLCRGCQGHVWSPGHTGTSTEHSILLPT